MSAIFLIPLIALFAPLPIMIIEGVLPFPSIIEELFSVILVLWLFKFERKYKKKLLKLAFISGILFSLSESFLYLTDILVTGNTNLFFIRLIFTTLIHASNIVFLYIIGRKGVFWLIFGFIIAVTMHFLYNNYFVYLIVAKAGF